MDKTETNGDEWKQIEMNREEQRGIERNREDISGMDEIDGSEVLVFVDLVVFVFVLDRIRLDAVAKCDGIVLFVLDEFPDTGTDCPLFGNDSSLILFKLSKN